MTEIVDRYLLAKDIASKSKYIQKNYLASKIFSRGYIKYRLLRPILKVYYKISSRKYGKESPWLTPASIEFLKNALNKRMTGLEYGSGRSTLFFSDSLGNLKSIEHDHSWYNYVRTMLTDKDISNVEYKLIQPLIPESKSTIEKRNGSAFDFEIINYNEYFSFIVDLPDEYFDFIIIDGRARVECSMRAVVKLKRGGIFILDNSERLRYEPVHRKLRSWKQVFTTTGLTDTTIWFKP